MSTVTAFATERPALAVSRRTMNTFIKYQVQKQRHTSRVVGTNSRRQIANKGVIPGNLDQHLDAVWTST